MTTKLMTIFTRTPLHVGAGSSVGAVDSPIIRERHTQFPVIPGSSIKGVLRDYAEKQAIGDVEKLFGHEGGGKEGKTYAGAIGFGEAKLLAFPVRSAKGSFALVTCPLALSRYARDAKLNYIIPFVSDNECYASNNVKLTVGEKTKVALEEYVFDNKGDFPADWAEHLSQMIDDVVLNTAKTHFVLISDGDFTYFAENACQVQHHNRIGEDGTVVDGALFNTETVPSEALFVAPVSAFKDEDRENELFRHFNETERLIQFGGNSTTGLGFCTVKIS